jgi:hypothetical protein
MKIKSQRDFVAGLMFIIVGIAFAWGATNYSFGESARPGPGYFPFGLGILLALLGAIVVFGALTIETEGGEPIGHIAWKPLIIILLTVVVFGFALPRLGLVITVPLLIFMAGTAGHEFSVKDALLSSVILTIGSWLIFIKGLGLIIPVWPAFVTGG